MLVNLQTFLAIINVLVQEVHMQTLLRIYVY